MPQPSDTSAAPEPGIPMRAKDQRRALGGLCGISIACVAIVLVVRATTSGLTPAAANEPEITGSSKFTSLGELMQNGVNAEAATLSYLIWHDQTLDESAMADVEKAAETLESLCEEMRRLPKRSWSRRETDFFGVQVDGLSRSAGELKLAARKRDTGGVSRVMSDVEHACAACHTRLAPNFTKKDAPR